MSQIGVTSALKLGSLPPAEYMPRRKKIEDEIAVSESSAEALTTTEPPRVEPKRVARLVDDWDQLDPATIRDTLGALIERIECLPRDHNPRVRIQARS